MNSGDNTGAPESPNAESREPGPQFLRMFAPEQWGAAERFVRFAPRTHEFRREEFGALQGVVGYFFKALTLARVARRLEGDIELDVKEIEAQGYSEASHSEEFAAVVEEVFGELYACLDTTRQVLKVVYPRAQGLPARKTSPLFENAAAGKIDAAVPEPIRAALAQACEGWFRDLRRIRTAVTHRSPGNCWYGEEGKIAYFNGSLGTAGNTLELDDVWGEIGRHTDAVNGLLGAVFAELNSTLGGERVREVCGMHAGLVYQREVSPREAVDFDSGVCVSYEWFDKPEHQTCPMSDGCGAYHRAKAEARAQAESAGAP